MLIPAPPPPMSIAIGADLVCELVSFLNHLSEQAHRPLKGKTKVVKKSHRGLTKWPWLHYIEIKDTCFHLLPRPASKRKFKGYQVQIWHLYL